MSGWRAGLIALALGGVILAVGWVVSREGGPSSDTTGPVVDSDLTLSCTPAFELACDQLAERFGLARSTYRPGTEVPQDTVVIGFAGDLPVEATPIAKSPIAIAIWAEKAPALRSTCGNIDPACLADRAGTAWTDVGGSSDWGTIRLGLADPDQGIADLQAWKLIADASPGDDFGDFVTMSSTDDGALLTDLVLFPSRADAVVASEVAIGSQLANARARAGRLAVFYPEPTPYLSVVAAGSGRAANNLISSLVEADVQLTLGQLGLRALNGESGPLLEDLGQPGTEAGPVTEAERPALVSSWDTLVGR
jgi:hypothetical protein